MSGYSPRLALVCLSLVACADSGPEPEEVPSVPATVAKSLGDNQSGLAGESLDEMLVVRVADAGGRALYGIDVAWAAEEGRGRICFPNKTDCHDSEVTVKTDLQGHSQVWYEAVRLGSSTVRASVEGLTAPALFTTTTNGLRIRLGDRLCNALPVQGFSDPLGLSETVVPRGTPVVWDFPGGFDICAARIVSTSIPPGGMPFDQALISGQRFTFTPEVAGVWEYEERETGAVGRLTVTGGGSGRLPARVAEIAGGSQTGLAGATLDQPFSVRVTDDRGEGVDSVPVTWSPPLNAAVCAPTRQECHLRPLVVYSDASGYSRVWFRHLAMGSSGTTATIAGLAGSPVVFRSEATGILIRLEWPDCAVSFGSARFLDPVGQSEVTVPVGTPVAWEFVGDGFGGHCSARIVSTAVPAGGAPFDRTLRDGERFSFAPEVTGTWEFKDLQSGATGRLVVTGAASEPPSGTARVFVMNADGSGLRAIALGTSPAWSPDGSRLAFVREGIHVRDLTAGTEAVVASGVSPSWSPDGTRLLLVTADGIAVSRLDDRSEVVLLRHSVDDPISGAAWSPDGARIAFWTQGDFDTKLSRVWTMDADGSDRMLLTAEPPKGGVTYTYAEWDATWSPDGKRIAFGSTGYGLAAVAAAGGAPYSVARIAGRETAWSPDGRTILITYYRPEVRPSVWTVPAGGGEPRLLIEDAVQPAWSPDGRQIAFVRLQR